MDITVQATRPEEEDEKYFGAESISVNQGERNDRLHNYISSRKYGLGRYVGSLVQIDSDRSVQTLKYNPVNWLGGDPDDAEAPANYYFNSFTNRWQDFMNYIHQKTAAREKKIAEMVQKSPDLAGHEVLAKFPNPLDKYKAIFADALPGKELLDIDPASPKEFHYKDVTGQTLNFGALSSGEQEVIKVLFDVARKEIRHSVILVDEPELHLHPTLAFKLIESLKKVGDHTNQFIFFTHSADLISTYYSTGNVYFIDTVQDGSNQGHKLSDLDTEHRDLIPLIGQNLGQFAVGKKIAFVEGEASSIDRMTYQKIAQTVDPEIRVVPAGSVQTVMALNSVEEQIRNAIFGVDLYMIRDRDGLTTEQIENLERNGRIRCLKRRHIENYFLEPSILLLVAEKLYLTRTIPELSGHLLSEKITEIARNSIGYNLCQNFKEHLALNHFLRIPSVKSIDAKTIDQIENELVEAISINGNELMESISRDKMESWLRNERERLSGQIDSGEWVKTFQGKHIFARVCGELLKEDQLRIRDAYVDTVLETDLRELEELQKLFQGM